MEQLYNVRVIIKDNIAFTPDTQEEYNESIVMTFNSAEVEKLVDGFGIDISTFELA